LIKVGKEWRKDLPRRIQVSLRVNEDMPSRGVTVKAYFYDENQKLVFTANQPNPVWTQTPRGIGEVLLPDELKRNKTFEVYFALPEKVTEAKWKSMVVVFG